MHECSVRTGGVQLSPRLVGSCIGTRKCLGTPSSTATGFPGITTGFPNWDSGTRGTLVGNAAFLFSALLAVMMLLLVLSKETAA